MYNHSQPGFQHISYNAADDGGGDFITDTLSSITGIDFGKIKQQVAGVIDAIKGREFTVGKYKLAEKFAKYVLGQDPGSWQAVANNSPELVNQSIDYFSSRFGIPITTIEDLDNLDPNYNTSGNNVADYKARDEAYASIPDKLVQQAVLIKKYLPYSAAKWDFNEAYQRAGLIKSGTSTTSLIDDIGKKTGIGGSVIWIILGVVVLSLIIVLIVKLSKRK